MALRDARLGHELQVRCHRPVAAHHLVQNAVLGAVVPERLKGVQQQEDGVVGAWGQFRVGFDAARIEEGALVVDVVLPGAADGRCECVPGTSKVCADHPPVISGHGLIRLGLAHTVADLVIGTGELQRVAKRVGGAAATGPTRCRSCTAFSARPVPEMPPSVPAA